MKISYPDPEKKYGSERIQIRDTVLKYTAVPGVIRQVTKDQGTCTGIGMKCRTEKTTVIIAKPKNIATDNRRNRAVFGFLIT